jgi:hypothetical protein
VAAGLLNEFDGKNPIEELVTIPHDGFFVPFDPP